MLFTKKTFLFLYILAAVPSCAVESLDPFLIDPKEQFNSNSQIINETVSGRSLTIYLPPNYNDEGNYKVIYFLDGHSLWGQTWDLENKLNSLISNNTIEPIVLIGIHSTGNRTSDLVPYDDPWITQNWGNYKPNAEAFSRTIYNQIIPYIEEHYAVSNLKQNKAFFGYSLGGLHVMWDGIHNNQKWGMIGALSPSFWVSNFQIFQDINNNPISDTKFWFDIGTKEWNYYVPAINLLSNKGVVYGKESFYLEVPGGHHTGTDWSARIDYLLTVFASENQDYTPIDWTIEIEFILSQSGNQYYKRINPIIKTANGIEFSASIRGEYELLNPEAGEVLNDGRFSFSGDNPLIVKVKYKNLEKTITINDID